MIFNLLGRSEGGASHVTGGPWRLWFVPIGVSWCACSPAAVSVGRVGVSWQTPGLGGLLSRLNRTPRRMAGSSWESRRRLPFPRAALLQRSSCPRAPPWRGFGEDLQLSPRLGVVPHLWLLPSLPHLGAHPCYLA